ncbi:DegT/DnrJ/EryC1/StrS family aminotransferase [Bacteroidota bacterium]
MQIPYYSFKGSNQNIENEVLQTFRNVFNSGWYLQGKLLDQFESDFSNYLNTSYSAGVGSGLDALFISLKSLGIGRGDEVILPSHTFFATALAVMHTGAKPILAEPDPETMNVDPIVIEKLISSNTKSIIVVHMYGHPAGMRRILQIGKRENIPIIEDFAQAVGASYKDQKCGTMGKINACSFYPVKNLGALGDGGAITTIDEELADFCRKFRNYGSSQKYYFEEAGINSRLDELQAAILRVKLKYLDRWNLERARIAAMYLERLSDIDDVTLVSENRDMEPSWHIFPIRVQKRDQLKDYLNNKGIETIIHYPIPIHLQAGFEKYVKGYKKGDLPIAEKIANTELSLPIYPGLLETEIEYITDCIAEFFSRK